MSLAVIKMNGREANTVNLKIDTGTNKYYYLKVGKSVSEVSGLKWIEEVVFKTNVKQNNKAHPFFDSSISESLDIGQYQESSLYVQLFSFKDKEGTSPCYSKVLKLHTGLNIRSTTSSTLSIGAILNSYEMQTTEPINTFRKIAHCDANRYAMQSSFEDILSSIVRAAGPIVTGIINGLQTAPVASGTGASATGAAATGSPAAGMLNTILEAFLRGFNNPVSTAAPATPATPTSPSTSGVHSMSFAASRNKNNYSRQFLFGIDDAILAGLIGSVAGPVLDKVVGPIIQMVPQLVGSHNQAKLQNKQMTNRLVTDLVSDVNRRMMLQQFLQSQQAAGNNSIGGANVGALLQLLQQAPSAAPAGDPTAAAIPAAAAPATAAPASLDGTTSYTRTLSSKAVLTFEHSNKHTFFGKEKHLYQSGSNISLKLKFNVVEPAPKNPLPKAIITVTFKDNKQNTLLEKTFKQKDVKPNTALELPFSIEEVQKIPINECIIIVAEMRWITTSKRVFAVLGSTEIVFVKQYFIKEQGKLSSEVKELSDMNVYRSFWNKVWESPVMDKVKQTDESDRKIGWELNGNLKYTVVLTSKKDSNGLMETKQLIAKKDEERVRNIIDSRMKSGIELSIHSLNKMNTLWDKSQPLTEEKLEAFKTGYLERNNISEFIYNIKLKGKDNQRGLVWVIPILKQQTFILSKPKTTLPTGEVQETELEEIHFPMPFAAKLLGLRSE